MKFIYNFNAVNKGNGQVDGLVAAENQDMALAYVRKMGLSPVKVFIDPIESLLEAIGGREFKPRDLIRFYRTMGDRIISGRDLLDGLDAANEFVFDKKLKSAIFIMANKLKGGTKIYEAMLAAGFNKIDAMTIRTSESSGDQGDVFKKLSDEHKRKSQLASEIKKIFMMPAISMFFIYVGSFSAPYFFGEGTEKMLKEMDIKAPEFEFYFDVAKFSHTSTIFYLVIAIIPLVGLFLAFKKGYVKKLLDKWKLWRNISTKSDMATTWMAFANLWNSGVAPYECASFVKEAAARDDSRNQFIRLEKSLLSGKTIGEATKSSLFPNYIYKGIKSAEDGGTSLPDGIVAMCNEMTDDVAIMTEMLKSSFTVISFIMIAFGILFLAYVTLGPVYLSILPKL